MEELKSVKTLAKVLHGSKLYGLDGPNSDTDIKGIFLPDVKDCILMRAPKGQSFKSPEENMEFEAFSLQRFLALASSGEDIIFGMLHASEHHILEDSDIYKYLRENKHKFYTKKICGALNYSKSMAMKYGYRADRMKSVELVLNFLKQMESDGVARLSQCWDKLPTSEHLYIGEDDTNRSQDKRFYEVAGKKLQATVSIAYALEIIDKVFQSYGDRVKIAKNMDGHDFKALSHSFRVGYQLYEIYKNGGFSYPLPQSQFIKDVKYGKYDYLEHQLDVKLNDLITKVEELSNNSSYPDKVDQEWLDNIVLSAYKL